MVESEGHARYIKREERRIQKKHFKKVEIRADNNRSIEAIPSETVVDKSKVIASWVPGRERSKMVRFPIAGIKTPIQFERKSSSRTGNPSALRSPKMKTTHKFTILW
jgi:hypothetical protein